MYNIMCFYYMNISQMIHIFTHVCCICLNNIERVKENRRSDEHISFKILSSCYDLPIELVNYYNLLLL